MIETSRSGQKGWIVHKFGGTSVANAERYRGVAAILTQAPPPERQAVVVSAMSKVTDALIELFELARRRDESYLAKLEAVKARHLQTVDELLPEAERKAVRSAIESDCTDIREVLRGIYLSRAQSDRTVELISGYGEIWSAQFLNAYLRGQGIRSTWLDARQVLTVESDQTAVNVVWDRSRLQIQDWLARNAPESSIDLIVITGFVASTADGIPTTLRRNGSDYSASIFGALLRSREIVIWTDVDGVLSADPRLVPEAVVLEDLSYDEATELAYFGAKVVHPSTMAPAIEQKIPIWIRNTFNPGFRGTKIHEKSSSDLVVKGFATIEKIALVNLEGTGMIGVPGIAQRLFGSLRDVGVSVVMISQASSEHSICFAIPEAQADLAKSTVERAFFAELHHGQIQKVEIERNCAVLAAVGDKMISHPGIAGRFFNALAGAGVNIRAIAQGSSERNISAVVGRDMAVRALRAVHAGFYLSNHTLSIGVIGAGLIGGTFLDQLRDELERLKQHARLDLRVRGIMNSSRMLLEPQSVKLDKWRELLAGATERPDFEAFAEYVRADHLPHAVLIDCTTSEEVTRHYATWLSRGIHVITPNKKGNTGTLDFYRTVHAAARTANRHYLYETTVGAGLPVINTLRDLVQTGDRVIRIEGVLSGTLSYIFNGCDGTKPFSSIVFEAKEKGYTEPDPRDDLSGMDVARKLVILAREMGLQIELGDVKVENLVPEVLRKGSVDEFLRGLPEHDGSLAERVQRARARSEVLRYVGVIEVDRTADAAARPSARAAVELRAYPAEHPFGRIQGSDNIVAFRTMRYDSQPLIVQGPGAGPDVTAGGVFADLLRLASYVGAVL